MMTKQNNKEEGARIGKKGEQVHATIPKEQFEVIKKLEGTMGVDRNSVVANIISMWLYSQEWFLQIINNKVKIK